MEVIRQALGPTEVKGATILEAGALDVNGSVRPYLESLHPSAYTGIDIRGGPGVDIVCDAGDIVARFGPDRFDIIVSTELLEHARDWRRVVHNFKQAVKPHGLLVVTTRSFGVDFHRQPFDFWRYQKEDFEEIFADFRIEDLQLDPDDPGLFIKARKPRPFLERDLSSHRLYSILRRRRKQEATGLDIFLFHVRYRVVRLLMDLLPKTYRRRVHETLLR